METGPADLTAAERSEIETELERAASAIAAGNDGKARVCARRACGVALRSWHRSRGNAAAPPDAQSLLKLASVDPGLPAAAREAAGRLSAPVSAPPAGSATTSASIDPIGDAKIVIAAAARASNSGGSGSSGLPGTVGDV